MEPDPTTLQTVMMGGLYLALASWVLGTTGMMLFFLKAGDFASETPPPA